MKYKSPPGFAKLLRDMRAGKKLIRNEVTRKLAEKAAKRRGVIPKDWAKRLAKDTGNATD